MTTFWGSVVDSWRYFSSQASLSGSKSVSPDDFEVSTDQRFVSFVFNICKLDLGEIILVF